MYPGGDLTAVSNSNRCARCNGHGQLHKVPAGSRVRDYVGLEPDIWFQAEPSVQIYPADMFGADAIPCARCKGSGVINA